MYHKMLEIEYNHSKQIKDLIVNQLQEMVEFYADCQAINIPGLGSQPRALSPETMQRTLFYLYKTRGPYIFREISPSTLFSPMFAFLYSRTKRARKELDIESFAHIFKKYQKAPKGVLRRYRRSLYNAVGVVGAVDEVGCMYVDCPDRNRVVYLKGSGVSREDWSPSDRGLVERFGVGLKLCSA